MKFPTTTNVFPPVSLSDKERLSYHQLADGIVQQTIQDYAHFKREDQGHIDATQWKTIKTSKQLTVYKRIGRFDSTINVRNLRHPTINTKKHYGLANPLRSLPHHSSSHPVIAMEEWRLPQFLTVGTIEGSLDDVMYGLSAPDVSAMLVKSSVIKDDLIQDSEILNQILGPTPQEPYQFLGLKWGVMALSGSSKALVRPRDFIFLESTGVLPEMPSSLAATLPIGSDGNLGFWVMQSVNLPTCPELRDKSVQRGKLSCCFLFRGLPNETVEVFMMGFVDPKGKAISSKVASQACAKVFLQCQQAAQCALKKKLLWLLKRDHKSSDGDEEHKGDDEEGEDFTATGVTCYSVSSSFDVSTKRSSSYSEYASALSCGVCRKVIRRFHQVHSCSFCDLPMCSRCSVMKTLHMAARFSKTVNKRVEKMCNWCLSHAIKQSTYDIACEEVLSGRFDTLESVSASVPSFNKRKSSCGSSSRTIDPQKLKEPETLTSKSPVDHLGTNPYAQTTLPKLDSMVSLVMAEVGDLERPSIEDHDSPTAASSSSTSSLPDIKTELQQRLSELSSTSVGPMSSEHQELRQRMSLLHSAVESIYQYTKETSDRFVHNAQSSAASPAIPSILDVERD